MRGLKTDPAAAPARPQADGDQASDEQQASRRLPGWLVVGLPALVELVIGGYRISGPSFWRDEAYTITGSQRPASAILAMIPHEDAFHGLYLLLMHPVIAIWGTSETALRMPSLIAMCAAVGLTAALGRRLARESALPGASAIGLIAGLMLAALPVTTRYAQEGRPYALTVLVAVLATYLLVEAVTRPGWRWWALYAAAIAVTGFFDLAAVLLIVAHGISLLVARRAAGADGAEPATGTISGGTISDGVLRRWLVACAAAAIVLSPVAILSLLQKSELDWVQPPHWSDVMTLLSEFAGTTLLIAVAVVLAVLGCIAGRGLRRGGGLTLAVIALPWLVLAPTLLLVVSIIHPVYVDRYILYCLPALVLMTSAGLVWLVRLTGRLVARRWTGRRAGILSVVPSAALAVLFACSLIGPQVAIRQPDSRADNLRLLASIVATHEQPGDAVLYLPRKTAVIGMAYAAPYSKLRDIGLQEGPIPSETLRGLPAAPSVVAARLPGVRRVWTVEWLHPLAPDSEPPPDLVKLLAPMHMVGSWQIQSVLLCLYAIGSH
ncbi:MAG TPA: glycosyltransferase family 39 protein [Streptosporangiaceae bacterium]|nr:glycosyltransferase family 39 protein [Streptosporangiaceae bacterium]